MEYNTTRPKLVIREYGRNVQKLVEKSMTIEDRKERTRSANNIVKIMAQLNPNPNNQEEELQKFWDHLFIISDFKLDVDGPFPSPDPSILNTKPERLSYKVRNYKYRYYGIIVEQLIDKAAEMKEGTERKDAIDMVASYMKQSYRQFNDEKVNDDIIINHLKELSNGRIIIRGFKDLLRSNEVETIKPKRDFQQRGKRPQRRPGGSSSGRSKYRK